MAINEVLKFAEEDGYPLRLSDIETLRGLTERMTEVASEEVQRTEASVLQEIEERLQRLTTEAMDREVSGWWIQGENTSENAGTPS